MSSDREQSLKQIMQYRLEKLEKLRDLGVNPYPYNFDVSHHSKEIVDGFDNMADKPVSVAGRIVSLRKMGKASFFHVQDMEGKIQVYIKRDEVGEGIYEIFKLLDMGDIVGISGKVFKTKTEEVSVSCEKLELLSKSIRPLPGAKEKDGEVYHAFKDKEQRYRHRHLDLIENPEVKDDFIKRARIIAAVRNFLDDDGFVEVETPVLQPLYGGASARPFTTQHLALDQTLYLRIADELYLKRLITGGFDGVYEISKVFRNEGMDRNHNPEFTMLEFYKAYVDYDFLTDLVESLIRAAAEAIDVSTLDVSGQSVDLSKPFRRARYMDLLKDAIGEDLTGATEKDLSTLCNKRKIPLEKDAHLGRMYEVLMRELVEPNLIKPIFVTDYPKVISPLAKVRRDGNESIVERFELFMDGGELANAFSELNDPLDQRRRFEDQVQLRERGDEEAHTLDEDYLQSVETGMPPTGGVGMGIDRLTMLLIGKKNIKDVILFPAMRPQDDE
ncbi:MAG TPA: lysine--tRNA ligase [Candidatus Marinimicrobia bacterium]|nr:lysine--tRNA ligase [Candidatus Neomarinimicrobiota bacterium]HIB02722.1 lysine--tRNA ligase [Candidatus Neomarinimicrobiota bacterium]HIN62246.1 lysine--tRNA ligase [Candidatus Neomarinimicrobiota bacterium]HIO56779.1 lysine--tRNA ligase [Candidatus Neomarinimicrobiota bacterium]HIO75050.1 lysine--tRNA ligase [Candidatus Neomarinimicrobiota bacterium]